jgi:hypothetical protein
MAQQPSFRQALPACPHPQPCAGEPQLRRPRDSPLRRDPSPALHARKKRLRLLNSLQVATRHARRRSAPPSRPHAARRASPPEKNCSGSQTLEPWALERLQTAAHRRLLLPARSPYDLHRSAEVAAPRRLTQHEKSLPSVIEPEACVAQCPAQSATQSVNRQAFGRRCRSLWRSSLALRNLLQQGSARRARQTVHHLPGTVQRAMGCAAAQAPHQPEHEPSRS